MSIIIRENKGFSLVEISVVLVIIGLILGASLTIWRSSILSTRLSTTKTNLDNIKNSVINYAMANGRLPCADPGSPNIGMSNPNNPTPPPPSNNCSTTCPSCTTCPPTCPATCLPGPPCYVPFSTLQLKLPNGNDSFGNRFYYDVSYDVAGGALGGLTNTTTDTFCGALYEYMSKSSGVPTVPTPYVTDASGNSYSVAAVIISETSVDNVFGVPAPPAPGLTGMNLGPHIATNPRQYNTANTANGPTYGDLVGELTYGDLYNKVCTTQKTKIRIQNYTGAIQYAKLAGTGACIQVPTGIPPGYVDIYQGTTVTFYTDGTCGTTCTGTNTFTFNMSAVLTDAGNVDWIGAGIYGRDGRVQITGTCATTLTLSDNTNANP